MRCILLLCAIVVAAITMTNTAHADRVIRKEILVSASLNDVWEAWTTSEGAEQFFAPRAKVELRPGGAYEMYFRTDAPEGKQGSEGCVVVSFEPMKRLTYTWNAPPELPDVQDKRTQVTVELEPSGTDEVKVRITHSGWGSGGQWDQAYEYFVEAWGIVLARLQHRFASGPIDWKNPYRP